MRRPTDEAGFSLVELLVGVTLFAVLSVGFYQVMIAQARTADTTRSVSRIADEARLGFNRMIREVREADNITWVSLDKKQFTIQVNYNNDSFYTTADNEILTFTYDSTAHTVSMCSALTYAACNSSNTEILMAGVYVAEDPNVDPDPPVFDFKGNNLEWDWGNPSTNWVSGPDGVVDWQEIDMASNSSHNIVGVGDGDVPPVLDDAEFPFLSSVKFALQVEDGDRATIFYATVQMRNKT